MKTQKMSLANIQGKLSRSEMKNIMAGSGGSGGSGGTPCTSDPDCASGTVICNGQTVNAVGKCYANNGTPDKTCHLVGFC